jgi:hypothetical protein
MSIIDVRRGRPPKFSRPARTVTMRLPEDVIHALGRLDSDLGRAVVRLVLSHEPRDPASRVEVATFGSRAVILVPPDRRLAALPGVELVPIADGRMLIALDDSIGEADFELLVRDELETGTLEGADLELFTALAKVLREARLETRVMLRRILVLHARAVTRRGAAASRRP